MTSKPAACEHCGCPFNVHADNGSCYGCEAQPAGGPCARRVIAEQKGPAEDDIRSVCGEIADMLAAKNRAYGNAALDPVRIFSKASPVEQILVRLDDKLSRLSRGEAAGEDVELDLIGYLVLLRVARRRAGR